MSSTPTPASDVATVCASVFDRFEQAWRSHPPANLEAHLPGPGEPERWSILVGLVHTDLEYRWKTGRGLPVEDYLRRFPELAAETTLLIDLVAWEGLMRQRAGCPLPLEDYLRRFPQHGPELAHRLAALRAGPPPAPPGYEILSELGRGGMGVVYRARQRRLNRLVALKMILSGNHAGSEERLRFLAEAEAAAAIQHPGVVQVFDFGTHGGLPYFALEFCPRGSLAERLNGTPLPPREAAALVGLLARAVQAAHDRGIVHRDLKPANVLMAADGSPKITDFGLARRVEAGEGLTRTGAVLGTPSYMAPEQARGDSRAVGPAADVYALGAILYECLTGRPPFKAATSAETLMQVVDKETVRPKQLNAQVPADLEAVCLKCLEKQPHRRYAAAAALADDLNRYLDGQATHARPRNFLARGKLWCRHPARVRDAGAVAALMMVVLTWWVCLGVLFHAFRVWGRGEFWPVTSAPVPQPAQYAVLHLVAVTGGITLPLFFIGVGTLRGKVSALWAGLIVSFLDVALLAACLAGSPLLDLVDVAGLYRQPEVRVPLFALLTVILSVVLVAYLLALIAHRANRDSQP
jgi:tRNA A-37 threonylcarbamoyl transferase component Bud32